MTLFPASSSKLEQALYRPWNLAIDKNYSSANSYGDYKRISRQIELWSLIGTPQYDAFVSYKNQLLISIKDVSHFYQHQYGWSEQSSIELAHKALTNAIALGFGFYEYNPVLAEGEEELRRAILQKKNISEIKNIKFDAKNIDALPQPYSDTPDAHESILNIAVAYPEALKYLLENGVDPNKTNLFGKTPLMYAAQYNQLESAKALIDYGASIVSTTIEPVDTCYYTLATYNMTALHYAARYASPEFIKLLLDNGAVTSAQAENNSYSEVQRKTPLDWLRLYTSPDSKEINTNIPKEKIKEIELWLSPIKKEDLLIKTKAYISAAEKEYQQGKTRIAYQTLKKALATNLYDERALNDMSLIALKNGYLGESFEAGDRVINNSKDEKMLGNAWFNQGLACEKSQAENLQPEPSHRGNNYCKRSALYYFLQAWQAEKSPPRTNKLISLFNDSKIPFCDLPSLKNPLKAHFDNDGTSKIYIFHLAETVIEPSKINWIMTIPDHTTRTAREKVRVSPIFDSSYSLGKYSIDEYHHQEKVVFPVAIGDRSCLSETK